jgi:hypothetical protein
MSCFGVEGLSDKNMFAFGASHNGIFQLRPAAGIGGKRI